MLTKDEIETLLEAVAQNQPRVCVAWCGKAKDDCACYKAGVAVGALNDAAPDLARTALDALARAEKAEQERDVWREGSMGQAAGAVRIAVSEGTMREELIAERNAAQTRLAAAEGRVAALEWFSETTAEAAQAAYTRVAALATVTPPADTGEGRT